MERSFQADFTFDHYMEMLGFLMEDMKAHPSVKYWRYAGSISSLLAYASLGAVGYILYSMWIRNLAGDHLLGLSAAMVAAVLLFGLCHYLNTACGNAILKNGFSDPGCMLGKMTYSVSESGISSVGAHHRCEISWGAINNIHETPSLVLFQTDPGCGSYIPRAAIPEKEYDSLLSFIRQKVVI